MGDFNEIEILLICILKPQITLFPFSILSFFLLKIIFLFTYLEIHVQRQKVDISGCLGGMGSVGSRRIHPPRHPKITTAQWVEPVNILCGKGRIKVVNRLALK